MIYTFKPTYSARDVQKTSTRTYEAISKEKIISTMWVKDLRVLPFDGLKKKDRDGALEYNNHIYTIKDETVRMDGKAEIYDESNNLVLLLYSDKEKYKIQKKSIFSKTPKIKERTCSFYTVNIFNDIYRLYDVSLGKDQQYYVVYDKNELVAIMHLFDKVVDYGRTIQVYSVDNDNVILTTMLFCFYLNMYEFFMYDEGIIQEGGYYTEHWAKSPQYLIDKFDENFIEKIKQLDK